MCIEQQNVLLWVWIHLLHLKWNFIVLFCAKVSVLVSRPRNRGLGLGLEFFKKVLTTTLEMMRQSISETKSTAIWFITPQVSMATGKKIITSCSLDHYFISHLYADDTQILGSYRPSASQDLLTRMFACIDEVAARMRSNRLQLNTAKTEFLWSTTSRRLHQPQPAALAEGSRADCIQTISPRVQVSTRVRTCIPYWQALSRLVSDSVPVHPHHWLSAAPDFLPSVTDLSRSPLHVSGTVCQITSLLHLL